MRRVAVLASVAIGVAMLMGTAMPASYADTVFTCNNSGNSTTNSVFCTGNDLANNAGNVTITNVQNLSNNQLTFLNGSLNTAFNVAGVSLQNVQLTVLNVFNNGFLVQPSVTLQQIQVCILSDCV